MKGPYRLITVREYKHILNTYTGKSTPLNDFREVQKFPECYEKDCPYYRITSAGAGYCSKVTMELKEHVYD